jgi:hypothetical protein
MSTRNYDSEVPPFRELAVRDTPQDAEELCVRVANSDHSVVPDTGSCMPLP